MRPDGSAAAAAARILGWVNGLLAAGMALAVGAFLSGALACGGLVDSAQEMDRGDSVAVAKIFAANGLAAADLRSAVSLESDGKVWKLDLSGRGVAVLPPEIGALDGLRVLFLGGNKLDSLPKEMERLVSLEVLEAQENEFASLPDGLRFESLRSVDLRANRIASLPGNFEITSVESLDLGGNRLASLPPDFRYLKRLKYLNLEDNRLESLEVDFSGFADLVNLDLSGNLLPDLPPSLARLEPAFLDVGNNRLCFYGLSQADTAAARMVEWLNAMDRDWAETQDCP